MLRRKIVKDSKVKCQRFHPSLRQRVGGDLHHHGGEDPCRGAVRHPGENSVQLFRLGGGHGGAFVHRAERFGAAEIRPARRRRKLVSQRANTAAGGARRAQDVAQHGGHGGFAVGAGHADQMQAPAGIPVPRADQSGKDRAGGRIGRQGNADGSPRRGDILRRCFRLGRVQHGNRTRPECVRDVLPPVGAAAGQSGEQPAGAHPRRSRRDAVDLQFFRPRRAGNAGGDAQIAERQYAGGTLYFGLTDSGCFHTVSSFREVR